MGGIPCFRLAGRDEKFFQSGLVRIFFFGKFGGEFSGGLTLSIICSPSRKICPLYLQSQDVGFVNAEQIPFILQ
jgi:hypothetical protein